MASTTTADRYRRVRRWVDHDLATRHRPVSAFGPLLLVLLAMSAGAWAGGFAWVITWAVVVPLYVVATGFVGWRVVRLIRAASIRGDRDYDQRGKFLLSTEYRRSESVTAASQRKRMQRRGSRR